MTPKTRLTATMEGDFVVFLIGMRINKPWLVHRWLSVVFAMGRMLKELKSKPELGFLHTEFWFGRTILLVQYWRSMDHLMNYAKAKDAEHLPAWRRFNEAIGTDGSVGLWHESYRVSPGQYENVYVNMPAFGLGRAGVLREAVDGRASAAGRLRANAGSER